MDRWASFFGSAASVAATLTGLVVVAISINLARILEHAELPARAAGALVPLTAVIVVALMGLIPDQSTAALGREILAAGACAWVLGAFLLTRWMPASSPAPRWRRRTARMLSHVQSLPFIVAGVLVLLRVPGGLYWIVPGVIATLLAGIVNTWVLLIEILR
jgi:modulator of FtsH protease